MRKHTTTSYFREFGVSTYTDMTDSPLSALKIRDLRKLEKAIQITIQLLSSYLKADDHDGNAIFLTLAAEGLGLHFKTDYIRAEISVYEQLLDQVQTAIRAK